jgi:hypothetical protein
MTPSKLQIVRAAYRDIVCAAAAMPQKFVIALLVAGVDGAAGLLLPTKTAAANGALDVFINFMLGGVLALLYTPLLIAIHRFILLGETTPGYVIDLRDTRFRRFWFYTLAINALFALPIILSWFWSPGMIAGTVVAMIVGLQMALVFPAVAADAPGANAMSAMQDSRGRLWFIVFTGLLALLPPMAILGAVSIADAALRQPGAAGEQTSTLVVLVSCALNVPVQTILVALASHLFRAFGDRLRRPPGRSMIAPPQAWRHR